MGSFRGGIGRVAGVIEYDSAQLAQMRQQFEAALLAITGDTRLFWMAQSGDTTTSTGKSLNAGTITWDATVAARLSALGLGYTQTFDASANYGTIPDNDIYSFGNSSTDSAVSFLALANVTDTAAVRVFTAKYGGTANEWEFQVAATDALQLLVTDQSAGASAFRASSTAITQGSWALFGATYSAATGGSTAANDMTLYQNGVVKASTATNNSGGTYVAMENLTGAVAIGATSGGGNKFNGSMALVLICQKNLSASDHWAIYKLTKAYFNY